MEHNFTLTGDEARALMMALASSPASVPAQTTISIWGRLNEINQVQPPTPTESND